MTIASQAEAEAGTDNAKLMTPLRVQQAIDNSSATAGHLGVGTYAVLINNSGSAITGRHDHRGIIAPLWRHALQHALRRCEHDRNARRDQRQRDLAAHGQQLPGAFHRYG